MTAIGQSLGEDVCKALPGMHALTGCDSTSAFVGKGKRQAFRLVESDPNMCAAMMMVGNSFGHDDERRQGCARFVCSLSGLGSITIVIVIDCNRLQLERNRNCNRNQIFQIVA